MCAYKTQLHCRCGVGCCRTPALSYSQGLWKYRMLHRAARYLGNLLYADIQLSLTRMWQPAGSKNQLRWAERLLVGDSAWPCCSLNNRCNQMQPTMYALLGNLAAGGAVRLCVVTGWLCQCIACTQAEGLTSSLVGAKACTFHQVHLAPID